jgi:7-cyano-7-deazaguanine synthase in queuosine biosynthesis
MILLLFSGGVESTILLKYFLKETNEEVHVLYTELGYDNSAKDRIPEQSIASKNVLEYLKNKHRDFNYSSLSLYMNNVDREKSINKVFAYDDQWNMFFGAMYAKLNDIKDIWIGHFSYNDFDRIAFNLNTANWFVDGTLEGYALLGTCLDMNFYKDLKINFPLRNFKGSGIDSFKSKAEAFFSLEKELQLLVRSCTGKEKFCGKCYKCQQYLKHNFHGK